LLPARRHLPLDGDEGIIAVLARADHGRAGASERAQLLLQIMGGFGRLIEPGLVDFSHQMWPATFDV